MGETERQLLDAAAVIGRSFDFRTLQDASGRQEEEAVAALDGLLDRDLVNEVGRTDNGAGITYDFSHEQLRVLVYGETSLARGCSLRPIAPGGCRLHRVSTPWTVAPARTRCRPAPPPRRLAGGSQSTYPGTPLPG